MSDPKTVTYGILAEEDETGEERLVFTSASLDQCALALRASASTLRKVGWGNFVIQDDSMGGTFTDLLYEHLVALRVQGKVTRLTEQIFTEMCAIR